MNQPITHTCRSLAEEMDIEQCINKLHTQHNYSCDGGYKVLKELLSPGMGSKVKKAFLTFFKRQIL